jgi:hypothetical protein
MPDGSMYVAVGSGFGGDNDNTGLPANGTGCMAWLRAADASLNSFTFEGCLLENNRTTGHVDPATLAWVAEDKDAAFFECPDLFPLDKAAADKDKDKADKAADKAAPPQSYVALASLYNWARGAYFTNEWWSGTIADTPEGKMKFVVERRGLLDFGQYYAARSGGGAAQRGDGRRVLFAATGWHNVQGWPGGLPCHTQMHLLPRDLGLDASGRLTIAPVAEVAATLRGGGGSGGRPAPGGMSAVGVGALLDLELNCTGTPASGTSDVVGVTVLAAAAAEAAAGQGGTVADQGVRIGYNFTSAALFVQGGGNDQTAPLADLTHGAAAAGASGAPPAAAAPSSVALRVLVDGALVESFANSRVAISSLVTNVFQGGSGGAAAARPADRVARALTPPEGVTCTFAAYTLDALVPPWDPP